MDDFIKFPNIDNEYNYNDRKLLSFERFLLFTELSVNLTNEAVEKELGRIDMYSTSDFLMKRELEPEAMLTGLIYIQRFKKRKESGHYRKSNFSFTSADLFLVSMMLASKYLFDNGTKDNVVNEEWAEDAGIETEDINDLEVELLNQMDWRLHVLPKEYSQFRRAVLARLALQHWEQHQWPSGSNYSELITIIDGWDDQNVRADLLDLLSVIGKVLAGCVVVYASVVLGVYVVVVCGPGSSDTTATGLWCPSLPPIPRPTGQTRPSATVPPGNNTDRNTYIRHPHIHHPLVSGIVSSVCVNFHSVV